ncbi:MAG: GTPase, partial [Pyrinomonadaceae bacterium]|nr:GTPase [Pyrinomonadaceae bacterium]
MPYDPPRQRKPNPPKDPLEIDLVYNVRPCGTCRFFWPTNSAEQPYGPYPVYDFDSNTPKENEPDGAKSFLWLKGTTRSPTFPDAEVMDGCRKAPIMTIGINPNLTAFAPGTTGASWGYPSFSSDNGTDSWTKYAYYYRYRTVYQEHFDLKFVEKYLLPEGQIKALKPGMLVDATRKTDAPSFDIKVQYDGETQPTTIPLAGKLGEPRYVVLVNLKQPFKKGDVLAARLNVPAGKKANIYGQQIGYYMQIVPVLESFQKFLVSKGHKDARLLVGEDVGQLDMVACASPHWGPEWLGGTSQSVNTVVNNCVMTNAWAMKQLVQTRPAILYLVGQSSWNMFRKAYGHLIQAHPSLPNYPEDGPYTLLRLTTENDCRLEFKTKIDGIKYSLSTRLIITPHFSYDVNFVPQFRMSADALKAFTAKYAAASKFLHTDPRIQVEKPAGGFAAFGIMKAADAPPVLVEIKKKFASAAPTLMADYYDPHQMMADVLEAMFDKGQLSYTPPKSGHHGFLSRTDGPCTFCVNDHWKFPQGCPYGKPEEKQLPVGFLEKVAAAMMAGA